MHEYVDMDVAAQPGALHVRAKHLPTQVTFSPESGIAHTLEGTVPYKKGDALLTGTRGECWPVPRERFLRVYLPEDGITPGEDGMYIKRPVDAAALRVDHPFTIRTEAGITLSGKTGDWLVQYHDGAYGIVAHAVFFERYEAIADAVVSL